MSFTLARCHSWCSFWHLPGLFSPMWTCSIPTAWSIKWPPCCLRVSPLPWPSSVTGPSPSFTSWPKCGAVLWPVSSSGPSPMKSPLSTRPRSTTPSLAWEPTSPSSFRDSTSASCHGCVPLSLPEWILGESVSNTSWEPWPPRVRASSPFFPTCNVVS